MEKNNLKVLDENYDSKGKWMKMEKIEESNRKCSECKKGYLKVIGTRETKPFWMLLIPFVKINTLGYILECNHCYAKFYIKKEETNK